MAATFSYELTTSGTPEQVRARVQAVLSERLLRPAGSTGSNLESGMRLSAQTATSLLYTPKLKIPLPISTTIWLSRKLAGERVEVNFAPADDGGTRVIATGKVGHGAEPVADRAFWDGVL